MADFGHYDGCATFQGRTFDAVITPEVDALVVEAAGASKMRVDYADLLDFRLLDYQIVLQTRTGEWHLSKLGHETENFFEKLWQAYNQRCMEALFVRGHAAMEVEGECAYTEPGATDKGIAKVAMYDDCLCVYPHDCRARRIPFCFSEEPQITDYQLVLRLDTGDEYRIAKLGRHTHDIFEKFQRRRVEIREQWAAAQLHVNTHRDELLGEKKVSYDCMAKVGRIAVGIFSLDTEGFWFAAIRDGRAAVELVTEEQTATYLYRYDTEDQVFEKRLRHAMESVALHREVIFSEITGNPLYQMSVQRNYHLQYLRSHHAGRIIHSQSWEKQLMEFMTK
ncbi:MAG: hypothetical protein II757_01100 [Bacteroidales bacterium]|nr:hypothetical protein [Bacteroidales bacterium]